MDGESEGRGRGRARFGGVAGVLLVVGLVSAPTGWVVTDHLERDDDFCNACHLEPGVPLHREIRRAYDTRPVTTLAAAHAAWPGTDAGFRCIDCHGGVSWTGRARVKLLAAKDAFWYGVGRFEEPTEMRWPLWDEDCAQCHPSFEEAESPPEWRTPRFHEVALHNVELGVACVSCHTAHDPGESVRHFLQASRVTTECARCHPEYESARVSNPDDPPARLATHEEIR